MEFDEEEWLQLSGIQHFVYCRRQWALAYMELQWAENLRTVEGHLLHENAHDRFFTEKRGDLLISRGLPIHSRELGVSGECDVVEFHQAEDGIPLKNRIGRFRIVPVEYKKGKPKPHDADVLQLVAQAMCLEEMFCCSVPLGFLYYGEPKRRTEVFVTDALRERVRAIFEEMHHYYSCRHTPKVKRTKGCNACSIKDLCLPILCGKRSAREYIEERLAEDS